MGQINFTTSASRFLEEHDYYQSIIADWITNINGLISPINTVIQNVESLIHLPAGINIPNWRKDFLNDIIKRTEIWVLTEEDIKSNKNIKIINHFKESEEEDFNLGAIKINNEPLPDSQKREILLREIEILEIIYEFLLKMYRCVLWMLKTEAFNFNFLEDVLGFIYQVLSPLTSRLPRLHEKIGVLQEVIRTVLRRNFNNRSSLERSINRELKLLNKIQIADISDINENDIPSSVEAIINLMEKLLRLRDNIILNNDLEEAREKLWGNQYKTSIDWLGCYHPQTGTIFLKVDNIYKEATPYSAIRKDAFEKLMQKVAIHEFIHSVLDVSPRDRFGNPVLNKRRWLNSFWNEESLDNALVLKGYNSGNPDDFKFISKVILNQPYYYKQGYFIFLDGEYELRDRIEQLLRFKIFPAPNPASLTKEKKLLTLTPKWNGIKEGYIDEKGKWVIDPIFDVALPFENGKAKVKVKNKWGVINIYGGWIERPGEEELPVVTAKAARPKSSFKGSGKKLRVTFPNGTVIEEPSAAATFVETIVEIGADKVKMLGIQSRGLDIVSDVPSSNKKYSASQHAINDGKLYVFTYSGTTEKKEFIEKISDSLGLGLQVDIL